MTAFVKMHGLSNDFVVVDGPIDPEPEEIRAICDRRTGIGADGLLAVSHDSAGGALRMQYWNADGSTAEMCGNGLRCVVRYGVDRGFVDRVEFLVETPVGLKAVRVLPSGDISVDLGPVHVDESTIVYDTSIDHVAPLRTGAWRKRAADSWHAKAFGLKTK